MPRTGLSRIGIALLLASALAPGGLHAQGATGKVQGVVRDPNGEPIANAQVVVLGTAFVAITNVDGFYFLNSVPAGTYELRAQLAGYQAAEMRGVWVLADQTLTADFKLSEAVALEALVVTAARAPIVPRDQVASKAIVSGDEIDRLPVNDALEVVMLQPGVVEARRGEVSIRGSRIFETAVFVDGAPVRRMDESTEVFGARGALTTITLGLATNTLAEVSVTTGAMEAAFGDAQGGVVSLVTRSGGSRYTGAVAFETDEMFGDNSEGYNRFEGSVSGPIAGNLTFSVGGTATGLGASAAQKGYEAIPSYTFAGIDTVVVGPVLGTNDSTATAIPTIVQYGGTCSAEENLGYECQGRRRNSGWATNARGTAKLLYTYGGGSRISITGLADQNQQLAVEEMNVEAAAGIRTTATAVILNWVQQVFRGADRELALDVNVSYQRNRSLNGALDRSQDLALRAPPLGIVLSPLDFVIDWDHLSDAPLHGVRDEATGGWLLNRLRADEDWEHLVENVRYDRGTVRPYLGRLEIESRTVPRMNAYGVSASSFNNVGVFVGGGFQDEARWVARMGIDWQADRYNRFKVGAEGTLAHIHRFDGIAYTTASFGNAYAASPLKVAAYAQDRLDLGDVVLELGFRWDRYDARTIFPLVPGRLWTNPAFDQDKTVEEMTCGLPRDECDPSVWVWYRGRSHSSLSPRLRVSFPVTDRTGFRLSYARQTQTPQFFSIYEGTNNDLGNTNTFDRFGGDVDLGQSILFEFGIRHAFSEDMVLDVSAYNKDKVSDITYRLQTVYDPFSDRLNNVSVLTNADFGNVRGVDIQLLRRFASFFSGRVSYTFQNARSTGSDPTEYLAGLARQPGGVLGVSPVAPQTTLRTRDDRRHNVQGTFTVSLPHDFGSGLVGSVLRDVGVFGTFQVRSGLPYTRVRNIGRGYLSSGGFGLVANLVEPLQASETAWEKLFDLRITKNFRLGPVEWTAYADVRNVFNFTNKPVVFSETGDVVNQLFRDVEFLQPELARMKQDAQAAGAWTTVVKEDGTGSRVVDAIDLTDLAATCPVWVGGGGLVACVMLQRTELRFGDGDGFYDVEEQTAAVTAYYESLYAPSFFYGPGRRIRLGMELRF